MSNRNGKKRASDDEEDESDVEMTNGTSTSNNNNKKNGRPVMEDINSEEEGNGNGARNGMNQDEEEGDEEDEQEEETPEQKSTQKRDTRAGYRKLEEEVQNARQHLLDTTVEAMSAQIEQANLLFANVQAPSEAVLDSRVLMAASDAGALKARALKLDANAFDIDDFLLRLIKFGGARTSGAGGKKGIEGVLKWDRVGKVLGEESLRVGGMDLMLGPLSIEVRAKKARVVREAHRADPTQRTQAIEVQKGDVEKDPQEATKMVRDISKILDEKVGTSAIPYLRFIINPESYSQTIENIFFLSFLTQDGKVAIEIDDDEDSEFFGDAVVFSCEPPDVAEGDAASGTQQMIFEMTMETWRDAIEAYNITESMIPTRAAPELIVKATGWRA